MFNQAPPQDIQLNVRFLQFIESYKDAILGLIKKTNQIRDLTLELTGNSAICLSVERGRDADDGVGDAGTLNGGAIELYLRRSVRIRSR